MLVDVKVPLNMRFFNLVWVISRSLYVKYLVQ